MTLYNWQRFAACKEMPKETFFDYEGDQLRRVPPEARQTCLDCPVRPSCYDHALKYEWYGFWAGTTRGQRIRLRKKLGIEVQSVEGIAYYQDGEYLLPKV